MAKTRTNGRRPRQPALLAELEPPRHPTLDDAADLYHELKSRRMQLTKDEAEAKSLVKELMLAFDLTRYTTPSDLECVREHEDVDRVHVKPKKGASNGDGE